MNKKILVTQSSMPPIEEFIEEIRDIWDTKWLTNNGVKHEKLAEELKKYLDVDNITLFTNGHLSLENAIAVAGLTGEVITTPFTFISTTHAIARNGLKPVFCDIDPETYTIDTKKIEALITDKTSAIIPVHVYGNICNVEEIEKIAKKHNLKVIYDAAHAFGVKYKGKSIANYGDISMFSFHATKVFNTIEGGALIYKNKDYVKELNYIKNFGIKDEDHIEYIGGNAKMNEFQASMGLCNLRHIDEEIKKRKQVYLKYMSLLKDVKGIKLNCIQDDVESNYAYFPIQILDEYGLTRDELYKLLAEHDIGARKYFYPISNELDIYKNCVGRTPIAKDISERILTLPMYANLEMENVEKICNIIKEGR